MKVTTILFDLGGVLIDWNPRYVLKVVEFPEWETEIKAFYGRWEEMLGDAIAGTVDILRSVKDNPNLRLYALTNWSAETFPVAQKRFEFLQWFEGIVMSGEEKTRKPFKDIYQIVIDRYDVSPGETVFIDDNLRNCQAASNYSSAWLGKL